MSKIVGAAAIMAVAGTAMGQFSRPAEAGPRTLLSSDQYTLTKTPISSSQNRGPADVRYSAMQGPNFFANSPTSGFAGFDDYTTDNGPAGNTDMAIHRFAGGVGNTSGVLFFSFFTTLGTFVDGYGVQLPSPGDFFWTITLSTPRTIPNNGIAQMFVDTGVVVPSTGRWFLQDGAPTTGSSVPLFGGGSTTGGGDLTHMQEIEEVPAPAGLALLGLGGALAARRRR